MKPFIVSKMAGLLTMATIVLTAELPIRAEPPSNSPTANPSLTVKGECVNYAGRINIVSKIDDHTYEAELSVFNHWIRIILITTNTVFASEGIVANVLTATDDGLVPTSLGFWADVKVGTKDEKIELPLSNGFTKKFSVLRESDACRFRAEKRQAEMTKKNARRAKKEADRKAKICASKGVDLSQDPRALATVKLTEPEGKHPWCLTTTNGYGLCEYDCLAECLSDKGEPSQVCVPRKKRQAEKEGRQDDASTNQAQDLTSEAKEQILEGDYKNIVLTDPVGDHKVCLTNSSGVGACDYGSIDKCYSENDDPDLACLLRPKKHP